MAWEIIKRAPLYILWRGKDAEGRTMFAATKDQREPSFGLASRAAAIENYLDNLTFAGDFLGAGDIAALANTTANTVHQWAKRYPEFRALAHETSAGLIWHESDVLDWLRRTGRLKSRTLPPDP